MKSVQKTARFAGVLYLIITVAAIVAHQAEIAFPLWLLIKGVNTDGWKKLVPATA